VRTADATVLPMVFAAGGDLRQLRGAPYTKILPVLIDIAAALEHAHSRRIVHRDLKPSNILLTQREASETAKVTPDRPSEATASVQLKIPVAAYAATLGQLGHRLGTQLALQQQAQDVTQQVADVDSQVASDQAAIAQLRALLSHAGSVGELLSVQNQINSEEANLESMQAQQRALNHQTSYATVTLTILGPKAKPVLHRQKPPPTLAGGFAAGWHALRIAVSWTLAFLGAIAPFAVVLAVAGYLVYRGRRWLGRRRPATGPASPES